MAKITEKELTMLGELMSMEGVMCGKCQSMAQYAQDSALKDRYTQMAQRHQRHFDELYSNLK